MLGLRRGIAHFSSRSQAPVVAAGLAGTSELWRGKEIRLKVGETIPPAGSGSIDASMEAVERAIREALPPVPSPGLAPRPWPWLTHLLR